MSNNYNWMLNRKIVELEDVLWATRKISEGSVL